jgi:hypothetical protein
MTSNVSEEGGQPVGVQDHSQSSARICSHSSSILRRIRRDSARSPRNTPANCIQGFSRATSASPASFASMAAATKAAIVCPFRAAADLARRNNESGTSSVVFINPPFTHIYGSLLQQPLVSVIILWRFWVQPEAYGPQTETARKPATPSTIFGNMPGAVLDRGRILRKSDAGLSECSRFQDQASWAPPLWISSSGVVKIGTCKPRRVLTRRMWSNLLAFAK